MATLRNLIDPCINTNIDDTAGVRIYAHRHENDHQPRIHGDLKNPTAGVRIYAHHHENDHQPRIHGDLKNPTVGCAFMRTG
ncbi:hypothetical protein [Pantoea rwandensis]|uniref:hypothetical protein n=1 Tax=Pantoea rwandensis TaxID=1076550 RepID=UPI00111C8EEA|nr:hypothetical protein [Pantoea rwandensis]